MTRVGVVGSTGYVGSELLRWIALHPELELAAAVSRSQSGRTVADAIPGLLGIVDQPLVDLDLRQLASLDVVFLATPHGAAAPIAAQLVDVPRIVDCSRDHRHAAGWVYGQPEWCGHALIDARRIAAPGCFATALSLAMAPLVASRLTRGPAMITAATGSTGSGASPIAGTHHPLRATNLRAYKTLAHQHEPEVATFLDALGPTPELAFVPLSAPVDRGIFASILVQVEGSVTEAFSAAYADAPMIRMRQHSPELRHVRGTAFADLAVHQRGSIASVLVALDNLGKGAAAQAIQALNLSLGLPGDLGLRVAAATP